MRVAAIDPAAGRIVPGDGAAAELERREAPGNGMAARSPADRHGRRFRVAVGLGAVVPTINFRVDYLRPAMTARLTATATVRRAGAPLRSSDIDVEDGEGRLVAVGRGCYAAQPG